MSIRELEEIASLQVQRDNGNAPNKKLPPVKNVSDDGMLVGITGVEPIWAIVLTDRIREHQAELFLAWCKKHGLPVRSSLQGFWFLEKEALDCLKRGLPVRGSLRDFFVQKIEVLYF